MQWIDPFPKSHFRCPSAFMDLVLGDLLLFRSHRGSLWCSNELNINYWASVNHRTILPLWCNKVAKTVSLSASTWGGNPCDGDGLWDRVYWIRHNSLLDCKRSWGNGDNSIQFKYKMVLAYYINRNGQVRKWDSDNTKWMYWIGIKEGINCQKAYQIWSIGFLGVIFIQE